MVNTISVSGTSLTGGVTTRPVADLDSARYEYITLDQVEPSPGNPTTDGQVLTSTASGVRSWGDISSLTLNALNFTSLDSGDTSDFYALFVKNNPFDGATDSVVVRKIGEGAFAETANETLATVTARGDSTQVYSYFYGGLYADSVVINGNLTVNGTQTILNTATLEIDDKNIVIAKNATNNAEAEGAGITVAGANAGITYASTDNSWNFNRLTNFETGIAVVGASLFDSATFDNDVVINNTDASVTATFGLFLEPTTNRIVRRTISTDILDGTVNLTQVTSTDADLTFYPTFVSVLNGGDSAKVDSALSYNASSNRLTMGNLSLTQIDRDQETDNVLVLSAQDSVSFRELGNLAYLDSEQDTLQSVTSRGATSTDSVTFAGVTVEGDLEASRYFDAQARQLVIYDSVGATLWGA
jgi:hypothetical protein|tara:strand:- start:1015 stop:2259 length:1245 start_codon:yes stop_codon:yes gene_type:complete